MKVLLLSILMLFLAGTGAIAQGSSSPEGNGKQMGVAINPVLMLFQWGSAEVNFWNINRNAEINIPLQFAKDPFFVDDEDETLDFTVFSIGAQYRYFFNEKQNGFFAQGGWQMYNATVEEFGEKASGTQNSILFGFGYRLISKKGIFWGTALAVGRAWGTIEAPDGEEVSGSGLALDIDLLKFGYAW